MPITINVKPDARSAAERTKQTGKSTYRWRCKCRVNKRAWANCPDCGMRRAEGERVDD